MPPPPPPPAPLPTSTIPHKPFSPTQLIPQIRTAAYNLRCAGFSGAHVLGMLEYDYERFGKRFHVAVLRALINKSNPSFYAPETQMIPAHANAAQTNDVVAAEAWTLMSMGKTPLEALRLLKTRYAQSGEWWKLEALDKAFRKCSDLPVQVLEKECSRRDSLDGGFEGVLRAER